jgi:3-hydroxyisobutyrate dehydrogenase-like beta-hydroxyacid dehydrogenase
MKVGFLGLGRMGPMMARNLVKAAEADWASIARQSFKEAGL